MIGDDIVITVLDVRGDQIRIGIRAPRSVAVHREEVYAELQAANREAASPSPEAIANLGRLLPRQATPGQGSDRGTPASEGPPAEST